MTPVPCTPKGRVELHLTEAGEYAIRMPNGHVSYAPSTVLAMRRAYGLHDCGYEVYIEGEPLIPQHGFYGWLHRQLDKLEHWCRSRRRV